MTDFFDLSPSAGQPLLVPEPHRAAARYPAVSRGDCWSRHLCRVSPALTDSLPPPESWNVGDGHLPALQTPAVQPLEGGTGSQLRVDAVPSGGVFPQPLPPW